MPTINRSEMVDYSAALPTANYIVGIKEVKHVPQTADKSEYIAVTFEVVAPGTIQVDGVEVPITGREVVSYFSFAPKAVKRTVDTLDKLFGAEAVGAEAVNTDAIAVLFANAKGKGVAVSITSEELYKTDTGKWNGTPIVDENNQKIIAGYRPNITAFLSAIKPYEEFTAGE